MTIAMIGFGAMGSAMAGHIVRRRGVRVLAHDLDPERLAQATAVAAARDLVEKRCEYAFQKWRDCLESQVFPSYDPVIHRVSTPSWIEYAFEAMDLGGQTENDEKKMNP